MRGKEITVVCFDFKGENIMQDNLPDNAGVVEEPFPVTRNLSTCFFFLRKYVHIH
jgi:hypothetical protein